MILSVLLLVAQPQPQPTGAGPFNATAPENRAVLPAFSYATVEPVLVQIGATAERAGDAERQALTGDEPFGEHAQAGLTRAGPGARRRVGRRQ